MNANFVIVFSLICFGYVLSQNCDTTPSDPNYTPSFTEAGSSTVILSQLARTWQFYILPEEFPFTQNSVNITGLQFKLDKSQSSSTPTTSIAVDNYDIWVSEPSAALLAGTFSATLAANEDNAVQVRSGALTIPADAFPGSSCSSSSNQWGFQITFTTPYVLTKGNGLVIRSGHTTIPQSIIVAASNNSFQRLRYGSGYNSATATITAVTPVVKLVYWGSSGVTPTPPPPPSSSVTTSRVSPAAVTTSKAQSYGSTTSKISMEEKKEMNKKLTKDTAISAVFITLGVFVFGVIVVVIVRVTRKYFKKDSTAA